MEPYLSGLFALGGTLLGGLVTYFVQTRAQSREDARHSQKMAYEAAVKTWEFWSRFKLEEVKATNGKVLMPCFNHFLVSHLRFAKFLGSVDTLNMSDADLARELSSLAGRDNALIALIREEDARRPQKAQHSPKG